MQRTTYSIAGQAVFVRLRTLDDGVETDNKLYAIHTDHLGSTSTLSYIDPVAGTASRVYDSRAFYEPFGDYRLEPIGDYTDQGYTGHLGNNSGSNDIGLIYMNARFYVPGIGRFASADTIVPAPDNPQSFNRFSYTFNNPINYIDPSGHFTEEAIQDYISSICGDSWTCFDTTLSDWQNNELYWDMLRAAEAGDIAFIGAIDGYFAEGMFYKFEGSEDNVLTGISLSDGYGNMRDGEEPLQNLTLSQIFKGGLGTDWGGFIRWNDDNQPTFAVRSDLELSAMRWTPEGVKWIKRAGSVILSPFIPVGKLGKLGRVINLGTVWWATDNVYDLYGINSNLRHVTVGNFQFQYSLSIGVTDWTLDGALFNPIVNGRYRLLAPFH